MPRRARQPSAVWVSAQEGDARALAYLLHHKACLQSSWRGVQLMHIAAANDHAACIDVLATARGGVGQRAGASKYTPLHCAAERGCSASVTALLRAGAYVHARSSRGHTPLCLGARHDHVCVVDQLAAAKAAIHAVANTGATPLHFAAASVALCTMNRLLELGADPGAIDGTLATPLHCVAADMACNTYFGSVPDGISDGVPDGVPDLGLHRRAAEAVQILLRAKAGVTNTDAQMRTPLHVLARAGLATCVQALVHARAKINTIPERGRLPLLDAIAGHHPCVAVALVH